MNLSKSLAFLTTQVFLTAFLINVARGATLTYGQLGFVGFVVVVVTMLYISANNEPI